MPSPTTATLPHGIFFSKGTLQDKHRIEFPSQLDDQVMMRLIVQQDVDSKVGLERLGRSILVFNFEPTSAATAQSSPSTSTGGSRSTFDVSEAPAFDGRTDATAASPANGVDTATSDSTTAAPTVVVAAASAERGGADNGNSITIPTTGRGDMSDCLVLVHNRYNGSKQLYLNQRLVYNVKKECTDGLNNSWTLPLSCGNAVLMLTNKFFSASGFQYALTLANGTVLFKST